MNSDPNLPIALSIIRDECGRHSRCRECPLQDKCIINPNGLIPRCWEIPDPPPEPTERQRIEWLRCLPDDEMLKAMDTFSLIYDCKEFNCFFTGHKTWWHKVVTLEQFRKDVGLE